MADIVIARQQLVDFYKQMVLLRMFDTKTCNLQKTGQIGTCSTIAGHEAIDVGAANALKSTDIFVPYYRDQGILLSRGLELSDILAYWAGKELANSKAPNTDLPNCVTIGPQYNIAAGVASAVKYKKERNAVLVCGGDASTNTGSFSEALNVASLWQLPLVFLIKNNQWAISTPSSRGTAGDIHKRAHAYNMKGIRIDGTDVVEVYQACSEAFERARNNKGPTLIEAVTYRLRPHTTVDPDNLYRTNDEIQQAWLQYDPVEKFKQYLQKNSGWSNAHDLELQNVIKNEIDEQVSKYMTYPAATIDEMFDHTYEDSSHLSTQKHICEKYFSSTKEH